MTQPIFKHSLHKYQPFITKQPYIDASYGVPVADSHYLATQSYMVIPFTDQHPSLPSLSSP